MLKKCLYFCLILNFNVFVFAQITPITQFNVSGRIEKNWAPKYSDIIGYWSFDKNNASTALASGTIVNNDIGPNFRLEATAPSSCLIDKINAKVGSSLFFDGNCHLAIDTSSSSYTNFDFDPSMPFSITLWFKKNGVFNDTTNEQWMALLAKGDNTYRIARNGQTNKDITFGSSSPTTLTPNNLQTNDIKNIDDDNWHFLAVTYSGSAGNTKVIYLDGITNTGTVSAPINNDPTKRLWIGGNSDKPNENYRQWKGYIDEVAIWKVALSQQEIFKIYQRQKTQRK